MKKGCDAIARMKRVLYVALKIRYYVKGENTMSKKAIRTLALSVMLILGTTLTVNAGENEKSARAANSWYVASYPGGSYSDTASAIRDGGSSLYIFTYNYSSSPSGSAPIYVTSPQSPDRLGINSKALRSMSYSGGVASNARIDVNFYASSSTDRIIADGSIDPS